MFIAVSRHCCAAVDIGNVQEPSLGREGVVIMEGFLEEVVIELVLKDEESMWQRKDVGWQRLSRQKEQYISVPGKDTVRDGRLKRLQGQGKECKCVKQTLSIVGYCAWRGQGLGQRTA